MSERSEFGHRAALGDKSSGTIWAAEWRPREARVGHMDVPQSGAQGTGDRSIVPAQRPSRTVLVTFAKTKVTRATARKQLILIRLFVGVVAACRHR